MDLYGIANNLDIFMRTDAKRQFPAITRSMIVPGQVLRSEATRTGAIMYMERYIDEDPDSLYLFIQCDARKGDASRDMAHRFFDKFFYDILHMPSTYDRASGMQPTQENPEFGRYDRNMAIHREILPAMDDTTFKRYYDEQVKAAQQEMARMMGIDPEEDGEEEAAQAKDDSDVIDMVDDGAGNYSATGSAARASSRAVASRSGFALGAAKPIFYAVDFHAPAAMQLGYDGDSHNIAYDSARGMAGIQRLGRGPNRRQLREKAEEELGEGMFGDIKDKVGRLFGKKSGDDSFPAADLIKCLKSARESLPLSKIRMAVMMNGVMYGVVDVSRPGSSADSPVVLQAQRRARRSGETAPRAYDELRIDALMHADTFLDKLQKLRINKVSDIKKCYVFENEYAEHRASNYPVTKVSFRNGILIFWVTPKTGDKKFMDDKYSAMMAEALGAAGEYDWFVNEALEDDGPDSWFVRESDPLHDEIAGMFDDYSGGSSWEGRDGVGATTADEKKTALKQKSRADGFGDFSHASSEEDDDMQECDRCGDPACVDGELCGLQEEVEIGDMSAADYFCHGPETAADTGDSEGGDAGGEGEPDDEEDDLEETESEDPDEVEDRKRAEDKERRRKEWEKSHPDDDMPDDDGRFDEDGGVLDESFSTQQIRSWNRLIMG